MKGKCVSRAAQVQSLETALPNPKLRAASLAPQVGTSWGANERHAKANSIAIQHWAAVACMAFILPRLAFYMRVASSGMMKR